MGLSRPELESGAGDGHGDAGRTESVDHRPLAAVDADLVAAPVRRTVSDSTPSTEPTPGTPRDRAVAAAAWGLAAVHLGVSLSGVLAFLDAPGWPAGIAGPFDGGLLAAVVALAGLAGAWRGGAAATPVARARRVEVAGGLIVLPGAWVALLAAFAPRTVFVHLPFTLLPLVGNLLPALAVIAVVYGLGPFAAGPDARRDVDLDWNERE
ncbi:hypothetical protein [Halobaculum sp. EA56]|uniref:hypothetical protein n=1 Tax=Halobaculum sp. EA56 TaxID=3421648 RepID=UPI003EB77724